MFAEPAGWGDFLIGVTAPFVALYWGDPGTRRRSSPWNILGVLDLVNAVALGVLSSTAVGALRLSVSTDAITVLPLSLIPTFAVPLLLIVHFILIAQATGWEPEVAGAIGTGCLTPQ